MRVEARLRASVRRAHPRRRDVASTRGQRTHSPMSPSAILGFFAGFLAAGMGGVAFWWFTGAGTRAGGSTLTRLPSRSSPFVGRFAAAPPALPAS